MRPKSAETPEVSVVRLKVIRHVSCLNPLSGKRSERTLPGERTIDPEKFVLLTDLIGSMNSNLFPDFYERKYFILGARLTSVVARGNLPFFS